MLRGLGKSYGTLDAVAPTDLDVVDGSFVSIIGPSGSGKSTLLRIVAGLVEPTTGSVRLDGDDPAAARRHKRIAMVPQAPALLPWRTVLDNACLLRDLNRRANPEVLPDPLALLDEVGLTPYLHLRVHDLSGGMQQRVALVRALALGARLLVMDEPFAALDELTRTAMRDLLCRLVERHGSTVLFVTHSIAEAVALADRVLVTSPRPGRIIADIAVGLPRPRGGGIDDDPRFVALCAEVRHALSSGQLP